MSVMWNGSRRAEIYRYINSPYVRGDEAIPSEQAQKNQLFKSHPKTHRQKYGLTHQTVTDTSEQLIQFFNGCHEEDKTSGHYQKMWAAHVKACQARKLNKDGDRPTQDHHHGRSSNDHGRNSNNHGNNERRGGNMTYRRPNGGTYNSYSSSGGRGGNNSRSGGGSRPDYHRDNRPARSDNRDRRDNGRRDNHNGGRGRSDRRHDDRRPRHHGKVDAHHVDDDYDDRSRSRSPSRSRRSPSRSPSRSPRRSESPEIENHFVENEDDDRKPAAKSAAASASRRSSSDSKKAASSAKKAPPRKRDPRWVREKKREAVEYDSSGKKTGFGSWYKRPYGKYSRSELDAPDGHPDRIRTIDIPNGHDYLDREYDDDSEKSSDWYDRTGVRPKNSK